MDYIKNKGKLRVIVLIVINLMLMNFVYAQSGSSTGGSKSPGVSSTIIQNSPDFKAFSKSSGFEASKGDLITIIASIIKYALGFLGIVLVLFILYGGYLWMTAEGETQRVDEAKKYIKNSIVGMIIIFSAYAISNFVLDILLKSTFK